MPYQHLLFAADLSPESLQLGKAAVNLAEKFQAKLSLIHVFAYLPLTYGGVEFAISVDTSIKENLIQQAQSNLTKLSQELNIPPNSQYLSTGSIKDEIVNLVKKQNIDLILVGHHIQSGLALLLGSTADSLLHKMPCDILALHIKEQ